jgi:hypothetical protein
MPAYRLLAMAVAQIRPVRAGSKTYCMTAQGIWPDIGSPEFVKHLTSTTMGFHNPEKVHDIRRGRRKRLSGGLDQLHADL